MSLAEEEDLEPYVRRRVEKSEERKRAMGMSEEVLSYSYYRNSQIHILSIFLTVKNLAWG